jgi:hypothetical protein
VAVQSLKDLGRLTYRRFLEPFIYMVGLLGRVISPLQGLYLHRTAQHRKTRTNIHALSGIQTHDPSNKPATAHASDRTATATGILYNAYPIIIKWLICFTFTDIAGFMQPLIIISGYINPGMSVVTVQATMSGRLFSLGAAGWTCFKVTTDRTASRGKVHGPEIMKYPSIIHDELKILNDYVNYAYMDKFF